MDISREEIRVIAQGAFLHDIGMLAIPESLQKKSEPLTAKERTIIRVHPFKGYELLRHLRPLGAAEIVYCHEERFDGKGYPRGLKGSEIPLGARIVSLAITLDTITSMSPNREPASFYAARPRIARYSGTEFDPNVVNAFLGVPVSVWYQLDEEIKN
jgi:HD-GYP domain-containing protein (c-di-GMP phosphodiesterase class II)